VVLRRLIQEAVLAIAGLAAQPPVASSSSPSAARSWCRCSSC
jgi:hypothetical protein